MVSSACKNVFVVLLWIQINTVKSLLGKRTKQEEWEGVQSFLKISKTHAAPDIPYLAEKNEKKKNHILKAYSTKLSISYSHLSPSLSLT